MLLGRLSALRQWMKNISRKVSISTSKSTRYSVLLGYVQSYALFPLIRVGLRFLTWLRCGYRHPAEIDSLRILWIDPNSVKRRTDNFRVSLFVSDIQSGDWDESTTRAWSEDESISVGLRARFVEDVPWQTTEYYQRRLEYIRAHGSWKNCSSERDLRSHCEKFDSLYRNIKEHGYKTQQEIHQSEYTDPQKQHQLYFIPPELREVWVDIGRNGDFLLCDGRHRLFIAKTLDIDRIPVRVARRHSDWQHVRDQVTTGLIYPPENSHPDLEYLSA